MADENDDTPNAEAPAPLPGRSFEPLTDTAPEAPGVVTTIEQPQARAGPRGVPAARVDPDMVKEFEQEIDSKVDSGRKRMRWFANHLMLFVVGITVAIALKLSLYPDLEDAFFLVPLAGWVGLLAIHANYAMGPMLRRSNKESQLKAVVPPQEPGESDRKTP